MLATEPAVTWIKVEKPVFDLVGVVLGSFHLAGILLLLAFVLGVVFGAVLILSRRRPASTTPLDQVSLHLGTVTASRDNARRQVLAFSDATRYLVAVSPDKAAAGPRPIRRYGNRSSTTRTPAAT